jgi:hypothetical protein
MFVVMLLVLSILYVQQAAAQKESHKEYRESAISECNACHKSEGIAPNHDGDWIRNHRTVAGKPVNNCGECHTQAYCLDCHKGGGIDADLKTDAARRDYIPNSHRSDFISIHPIQAAGNPQSCYRCHEQKQCSQCHDRFPKGSLRIKSHIGLGANGQWYSPATVSEHATEARRNLQSCASCHPEGDVCVQCHKSGGVRPHPRNWKSDNWKDRTKGKVCLKCHLPGTF